MRAHVFVVAALLGAGSRILSAQELPTCRLLSAREVAAHLDAPAVRIDSVNSGTNMISKAELCAWYVREGSPEGVMFKHRRATTADDVAREFLGARLEEEMRVGDKATVTVPGLADEALYRAYPDGKGGSLVFRKGRNVFGMTGSASKEAFIAMARLIAPKLQ
jgi:hypothetical protein